MRFGSLIWQACSYALAVEGFAAAGSSGTPGSDLVNLGRALIDEGNLEEGFSSLVKAYSVDAFSPGVKDGFREYYEAKISAKLDLVESLEGLAVLEQDSGRFKRAAECFESCLEHGGEKASRKSKDWWFASLFKCLSSQCDWSRWEEDSARMQELVEGGDPGEVPLVHPFDALSYPLGPHLQLKLAMQQAEQVKKRVGDPPGLRTLQSMLEQNHAVAGSTRQRPIKLGYVSGDLMESHPMTHLIQSVFGLHNPELFTVHVYALNPSDSSASRARIERECSVFRDLSGMTAAEASRAIQADRCQILINLNGYAGCTVSAEIFALRPAPLALHYMGFPGTMGAPFMDYLIADSTVVPSAQRQFYSESIISLPHSYFVNDYKQSSQEVLTGTPPAREEHGLTPDATVLVCFNRPHKIDPAIFEVWLKVLQRAPRAVLWLLDGGKEVRDNLREAAARVGVSSDRLVFAPVLPKREHLQRLRLADLALDTPLYNAHTVGCDALWAGVPMVSLPGDTMAARVGSSLVQATGLGHELVVQSLSEYESKVVSLCSDAGDLEELREKLQSARMTCPLFDSARWVSGLEKGLLHAWERVEEGLDPKDIHISEKQHKQQQQP
ncbi:unnamed protein product [Chrysoparadoxa australica]